VPITTLVAAWLMVRDDGGADATPSDAHA
jgi:hypothetical protein